MANNYESLGLGSIRYNNENRVRFQKLGPNVNTLYLQYDTPNIPKERVRKARKYITRLHYLVVKTLPDVVVGLDRGDEVAGDEAGSLVDELVEGVLAVGAGLTPNDRAGGVVDLSARTGNVPIEKIE